MATTLEDELWRETIRRNFRKKPDDALVCLLLSTQKLAECRATGKLRKLLEGQSTLIDVALERFAPDALEAGLELYFADGDENGWAELTQADELVQGIEAESDRLSAAIDDLEAVLARLSATLTATGDDES